MGWSAPVPEGENELDSGAQSVEETLIDGLTAKTIQAKAMSSRWRRSRTKSLSCVRGDGLENPSKQMLLHPRAARRAR